MNIESATRKFSKDEIIVAIQECAAKLGRTPSQAELKQASGIGGKIFQRQFGNYTKALRACGLEGRGAGFMLSTEELFTEWAGIVRETGEVPSISEYALHSKHSLTPLRKRFGGWSHVPAGLLQYAQENGLEEQWADVLEVAKKHRRAGDNGRVDDQAGCGLVFQPANPEGQAGLWSAAWGSAAGGRAVDRVSDGLCAGE
jgi:hypothetical protein